MENHLHEQSSFGQNSQSSGMLALTCSLTACSHDHSTRIGLLLKLPSFHCKTDYHSDGDTYCQ
jgi:hypothetical protein